MSLKNYSITRRRVAHSCWTLLAFTILAAPGVAWAQCNSQLNLSKSPELNASGGYTLGDTVTINTVVGGGSSLTDLPLTVSEFRVALDCISSDTGPLNNCLGYGVDPIPDAAAQDDGDAVEYAGGDTTTGNLTVTGAACSGSTFAVNSAGTSGSPADMPNVIILTATPAVTFAAQQSCTINFDVHLNSYGTVPEAGTTQVVNYGAGFKGSCTELLSAAPQASDNYLFEVVPDIQIKKYVNVDGGGWEDANVAPFPVGIVPSSTAEYRLVVTNIGNEPLENVLLNDTTLGLASVPLPDRCYVDGVFPPLADAPANECIIESSDTPAFDPLGSVDVCLTAVDYTNIACTNGDGVFSGIEAGEVCDPATVECIPPELQVTKDGPPLAKAGDDITYEICATNTGGVDLANCVLDDTLLGGPTAFAALLVPAQEVCQSYPYTIGLTETRDPLPNEATVTCEIVGAGGTIDDDDTHEVNLFQPSIDVTKVGDLTEGKVGDDVCYDIGFTNTSSPDTPPLINCTGVDTLLDLSAVEFVSGQTQQFCRTIETGDPNPLVNEVTITCLVDGFDNAPSDKDTHEVDLFEVGAVLSKTCVSDPPDTTIMVPDPIAWEICVENTGDKAIDCTINDPIAGITNAMVSVAPAATDCSTTNSRPTTSADIGTVTNTATAVCEVPGYDNEVPTEPAIGTCVVDEVGDEFCRTPGFWGTHAGIEKSRANNLTQAVIDAAVDGELSICGQTIDNTNVGNMMSAVEAMCVHPKGEQQRQLARQLTAAALNCVVFGAGADCAGSSIATEFAEANAACAANAEDLSQYIETIDAFNNSEDCHEAPFADYEVFDQFDKVPGPAGSPRACSAAVKNDTYVVPATP